MEIHTLDDHLGGYVPGGDNATWYPALWQWLVRELKVKSVLDVGCGDGVALNYFRELGCRVCGLDGVEQPDRDIYTHDFTREPWPGLAIHYTGFDLVWCCEFVEHVEEDYVPNFLEAFKLGQYVSLTHAEPGQAGHHHVNCRTPDYWIGAMAATGYRLDDTLTEKTRELARFNPSQWNHYARSGLFFYKEI